MNYKFLNTFQSNINQLVDLCESPIEKKVLEYILETVFDALNSDFNEINSPSLRFLSDYVFKNELKRNISLIQSSLWKESDEILYKIKGVELQFFNSIPLLYIDSNQNLRHYERNSPEFQKIKKELSTKGATLSEESDLTNIYKIQIIPQFEVLTKQKRKYRLDFGLIKSSVENDKIIELEKICIECDGHDYHSTKEQILRDNTRARELTLEGWKIYRFSGSEIQIKKNVVGFLYELFS